MSDGEYDPDVFRPPRKKKQASYRDIDGENLEKPRGRARASLGTIGRTPYTREQAIYIAENGTDEQIHAAFGVRGPEYLYRDADIPYMRSGKSEYADQYDRRYTIEKPARAGGEGEFRYVIPIHNNKLLRSDDPYISSDAKTVIGATPPSADDGKLQLEPLVKRLAPLSIYVTSCTSTAVNTRGTGTFVLA